MSAIPCDAWMIAMESPLFGSANLTDGCGMLTNGTTVREMMSQRSPIGSGRTGSTLSSIDVLESSPPPVV